MLIFLFIVHLSSSRKREDKMKTETIEFLKQAEKDINELQRERRNLIKYEIELEDAHVLEKLGDLEGALQAALRAVELSPDEVLAHTTLSVIYMRKGMVPEAEAEKAVAAELQRRQDAG